MLRVLSIFIALAAVVFLGVIVWQMTAYRVGEPQYSVIKADESIEVRQYPSIIVAQVTVRGDRYEAVNTGFRLLADYIFGNNSPKQKIAMTAPVIQLGEMPAKTPLTQQLNGDNWIIRFVMPAGQSVEMLPKPNNADVKLITMPKKEYVVIRFAGLNTDSNMQRHLEHLLAYVKENKLQTIGNPIMAYYNPPWILPFLRRNEIMLELK